MKLGLVFVLSLVTNSALACTCIMSNAEPRSDAVSRFLSEADIVVLARLDSKNDSVEERRVRSSGLVIKESYQKAQFTTVKVYKGEIEEGFTTKMVSNGISCNYYFRATGEYVLYFYKPVNQSSYRTSLCQGTIPVKHSSGDLDILESLTSNQLDQ